MTAQNDAQLAGTLFNSAINVITVNVSDSSGTFSFKFGLDVANPIQKGSASRLSIYAALTSQQITSSFSKGISLSLETASLTLDNSLDGSIKIVTATQGNLLAYYLENINTNLPDGSHTISARLIVTTIDVNYIGFTQGSIAAVTLEGTVNITG